MKSLRPVFIGGTGRSGTTVFFKLLSQHPQVAALSKELRILVDPGGALDVVTALSDEWSPYRADDAIGRFQRILREVSYTNTLYEKAGSILRRLGVSPPRYLSLGHGAEFGSDYRKACEQLMAKLIRHTSRASWGGSRPLRLSSVMYETSPVPTETLCRWLSEFFDSLYRHKGGQHATHWIDSTPFNFLHFDRLLQIFPQASFIHVYRDPRDVLSSYLTKSWGGNEPVVVADRIAAAYERWFQLRRRLPKDSFQEVSLEQFAIDPEGTMRATMEFANISPHELPYSIVSKTKANGARWKTDIGAKHLPAVLNRLVPVIEQLGYESEVDRQMASAA